MEIKKDILKIIEGSIRYVLPENLIKETFEKTTFEFLNDELYVVSIGKAAWNMASSISNILGEKIKKGIVLTKYEHSKGNIKNFEIFEAGHPIPDENSIFATEKILEMTKNLTSKDTIIFLVSGGGSALFEKPLNNISLKEISLINKTLINSGANINEINLIRKRLSSVKAGRFAEHVNPAKIFSFILSDVIDDDLSTIASGPCYYDSSTFEDIEKILIKYNFNFDEKILNLLKKDTPKKINNSENYIIGNVKKACYKAKEISEQLGYNTYILTTKLDCEAKEAGYFLSSIISEIKTDESFFKKPCALILGGETSVKVLGKGVGGRNQELVFSTIKKIKDFDNLIIASVGTDGTDGPTNAAGGIVDGNSFRKLILHNIDYEEVLKNNDSYNALKKIDNLIISGPTGTNVNDLIIALVI